MNEQEFLEFCSRKQTDVAVLINGDDPVQSNNLSIDNFCLELFNKKNPKGSYKLFLPWASRSQSQLAEAIKFIVHAEAIGYKDVRTVITATPRSKEQTIAFISGEIERLSQYGLLGDYLDSNAEIGELIKLVGKVYLPPGQEDISPGIRRLRLNTLKLDEIVRGKFNFDASDPEITRRIFYLRDKLARDADNLNLGVSIGRCSDYYQGAGVIKRDASGRYKESFELLLLDLVEDIYILEQQTKDIKRTIRKAGSVHIGGGRPDLFGTNNTKFGGITRLKDILPRTYEGFSYGCQLASENVRVLEDKFRGHGFGLALTKLQTVVHGERYVRKNENYEREIAGHINPSTGVLEWHYELDERALKNLAEEKQPVFMFFDEIALVQATNRAGKKHYRTFGTNGVVQVYYKGRFIEQYCPAQEIDIDRIIEEIKKVA